MNISGKIEEIKDINENIVGVILKKQRNKNTYYVCVLFYYQFAELVKKEYCKSDFVKIWFRVRSNRRQQYDGDFKYYTDIIGEKITLIRREGKRIKKLTSDFGLPIKDKYVDEETGEMIVKHTLKNILKNTKK